MRRYAVLAALLLALGAAIAEEKTATKVAINFLTGEWTFLRHRIETQSGLPSRDGVYGHISLKEEGGNIVGYLYENTTGPAPTLVNRRLIRIELTSTIAGAFKIARAAAADGSAAAAAAEADGETVPGEFFDVDWEAEGTQRDVTDEEEFAMGDGHEKFRTLFEFSLDPAFHGGLVSYDRWHGRAKGFVQLLATTTFSFTLTVSFDPAPGARGQQEVWVLYARKNVSAGAQGSFWQRYGSTAAILIFFVVSKLFRMKFKTQRGVPPAAQRARLLAQKRAQEKQGGKDVQKAISMLTRPKEGDERPVPAPPADAGGGVLAETKKES
eukprot:tig00000448_g849.t1